MAVDHVGELAASLRDTLLERRRRRAASGRGAGPQLMDEAAELVAHEAAALSPGLRARILEQVRRDTVGLGPLEEALTDPTVTEVMVNGPDEVYVERSGRVETSAIRFAGEQELRDTIERVLAHAGRRVDESSPAADGRLASGSRVHVVIPPLALGGPTLTIRRFGGVRPGPRALVAAGAIDAEAMTRLAEAVRTRRSILVSGGTSAGKTTLLNALSAFFGDRERIVTIEDSAELRLLQPHVVRLEARPPTLEGTGAVGVRELLRNALRMRPDRIVIGEVRGAEAFDLLNALNTGHPGSLSTIHANSVADARDRLQLLCLTAGTGLAPSAIRRLVDAAIDVGVHLERGPDGRRRVTELAGA
ncbi:MAG: CpaF family protein [Solirubrobacterales bacterium]